MLIGAMEGENFINYNDVRFGLIGERSVPFAGTSVTRPPSPGIDRHLFLATPTPFRCESAEFRSNSKSNCKSYTQSRRLV